MINGGKLYNLAQVLKTPGIKVISAKNESSTLTPAVTDSITAHASIHIVYSNGKFLCGYGLSTATAVPNTQIVSELGDLFVNGNSKDSTDTGGFGTTTGETGCWSFASNTYWEMYSSAATTFPDGKQGFAETSTTAYEP